MIKQKLTLAAALSSVALIAPASSMADVPQRYIIEMQIYDGADVVSQPRLVVEEGQSAVFSLHGVMRQDYDIEITPKSDSASIVSFLSKIKVSSPGTENRLAEPALTVKLGQKATIEFGEKLPTQSPFKMELRFTAVG